jgi:hypothetical protein
MRPALKSEYASAAVAGLSERACGPCRDENNREAELHVFLLGGTSQLPTMYQERICFATD